METMEHEVWIKADPNEVFTALTTKEGLDAWWGPVLSAEPRIGSVEFDHGLGAPLWMEITDPRPEREARVALRFRVSDPSNPASEWRGQELVVELAARGPIELLSVKHDVTVLRFRVTGWPAKARWYGFCNTAWGETLAQNSSVLCKTASPAELARDSGTGKTS